MTGYTPGEQPRDRSYVKLNTNENPYPPSPQIRETIANFALQHMRLYPEPTALQVREEAAHLYGFQPDNIICGNGSDDLLTMAVRTFVDQGGCLGCFTPSYSLYPVLAQIQGAETIQIPLENDFTMPPLETILKDTSECNVFFLTRPNAPTGNNFCKEKVAELCQHFKGIVWIDEAYADFAADNCIEYAKHFSNVIVSRSFSKSYSLAGIRFGLAFGQTEHIHQMMKVKDSYNVNALTQKIALAALQDQNHMQTNVARICATRRRVAQRLEESGFTVLPSEANFLLAKPPVPAQKLLRKLREEGILVRYFDNPLTADYIRITVGTDEEMDYLLAKSKQIVDGEKA